MIRTLENDQLRVQINDLGAELTEIYDKTNDRQVLWNADPSYWNRHAPVLFPNVLSTETPTTADSMDLPVIWNLPVQSPHRPLSPIL